MKPDGVDTAEPMEVLGPEPVVEGPAAEEEPQPAPPPSQPEEEAAKQQAETETVPPAPKEENGKPTDPKAKTKGPTKTKPGTAGTKTMATSGPGSRPGTAQNRITNGAQKPVSNGVLKKTSATVPEKKKPSATTAAVAPSKRPGGVTASPSARPPAKAADKRPAAANRPATAPSGMTTAKTASGAAQPNKKAPAAPSNGVKAKPTKTTAPRPASTAASKPSAAAPTKTDRPTVPKTTRPTGAPPASRPAPTTTAAKPAAASTRPTSSRPGATAPSAGRNAVGLPSKTTAPAKKDVSKPTTALAKKPAAAASTRPPTTKPSKPEPPKPATTTRLDTTARKPAASGKATDSKPARPKPQDGKPPGPMAEVKASPRAAGLRPGLGKLSTPSPKKPVGTSSPMAMKRGGKPTQSVQPLAASGEPVKKTQTPKSPGAAAAKAGIAGAASVVAVATVASELLAPAEPEQVPAPQRQEQAAAQVTVHESDEAMGLPAQQQPESLLDLASLECPAAVVAPLGTTVLSPPSSPSGPASLILEPQSAPENLLQDEREQEAKEQKEVLVPIAAVEPMIPVVEPEPLVPVPASLAQEREEAIEKAEEENNVDEEGTEEEDREGSQQVSVSEMSGTQPTEESRPGSAGLAGSAWRGGALLSELDSEEVSGSQQGASELSAPGVLEGTESMDDLGDASLKGADAGSPDIETVPDIPANEEEEEEEDDDDEDQVYDMEVGSERVEDPRRTRHGGEDEEEDEDVEMASEGVTESGLESYGNADEDDLAEDDRLDNLNRGQLPMQPPLLPTAPPPPAQWSNTNPFADPWSQPPQPAAELLASPSDTWPADPETPTQSPAQAWLELSTPALVPQTEEAFTHPQAVQDTMVNKPQEATKTMLPTPAPARGMSQSSTLSGTELAAQSSSETSTPEELRDYNSSSGVESRSEEKQQDPPSQPLPDMEQDQGVHLERGEGGDEEEEAETLPADEVLGGPPTAPASAPSSPSTSGDEASDTEGEMQINEPDADMGGIDNMAFDNVAKTTAAKNLPALEEAGEGDVEGEEEGGDTPQSANSVASYGFDCTTTTSNSNAHSTAESCGKSPGIFSLENEDQLPEEAKDPSLIKELTLPAAANADAPTVDLLPLGPAEPNPDEQQYMLCGKLGAELPDHSAAVEALPQEMGLPLSSDGDGPDVQPPYYSAICEKTDNVLSGRYDRRTDEPQQQQLQTETLQQQEQEAQEHTVSPAPRKPPCPLPFDHVSQPRPPPMDLPLRSTRPQPNAQLRRLEQHQQQLLQIQRKGQERQRQLEGEEEQCRKRLEEKEAVDEEEEERQRQEQQRQLEQQRQDLLQLQLHLQQQQQQQEELKHRQQILQWQHELEQQQRQHKAQSTVLLSPSSGLCTIYETMETSDEEEEEEEKERIKELAKGIGHKCEEKDVEKGEGGADSPSRVVPVESDPPLRLEQERAIPADASPPASPSDAPPRPQLDLDWSKKVDIVQQLINETLLLAGDGCPPLLLLPGGGGGTLSPLESSLWPSLLPPLTPPSSATVTSVSSFSPEDQGSSPQGEWTVVELETHH